jgi:Ca2+-binding EF-hand superfamily protein
MTKSCSIWLGLLGVLVAAAEPQQTPGGGSGRGPFGGGSGRGLHGPGKHGAPGVEAWRRLDTDGSNSVSYEEFVANERLARVPEEQRREIFRRLDKNADGVIQPGELVAPAGFGGEHHGPLLWELDRNRDRAIDFAEFQGGRLVGRLPADQQRALFDRMDRDRNGVLDGRDHPEGGPGMLPRLTELDQDGSGGVSFSEFSAADWMSRIPDASRRAIFERLDRNGDGQIQPAEFPKRPDAGLHRPPQRGARPRFDELDRNHDGSLSFDEFGHLPGIQALDEDAREERFEQLDRNDDLKLDRTEFEGAGRPGPGPGSGMPKGRKTGV